MVKRINALLSLFFFTLLFAFSSDLFLISAVYSSLDALSTSVAHQIAIEGKITPKIIEFVESSLSNAHIESIGPESVEFGSVLYFRLFEEYRPIIMNDQPMEISITRETTIGYLNVNKE